MNRRGMGHRITIEAAFLSLAFVSLPLAPFLASGCAAHDEVGESPAKAAAEAIGFGGGMTTTTTTLGGGGSGGWTGGGGTGGTGGMGGTGGYGGTGTGGTGTGGMGAGGTGTGGTGTGGMGAGGGGSSSSSSSTGGPPPALKCPAKGPAALNDKLPEPANCTATDMTKCNGWTPVGPVLSGLTDLAVGAGAGKSAQLFMWRGMDADGLPIQCLYLARRGPGAAEGVLCFNEDTCEVCPYDLTGAAPTPAFSDLGQPPGGGFATDPGTCTNCHVNGPIAPTSALYNALNDDIKALSVTCAEKGGPTWIGAPGGWPAPPGKWTGPFADAECMDCHEEGFAKTGIAGQQTNYCGLVVFALTNANGSMKNKLFTAAQKQDCVAFTKGIGCDAKCGDICKESVTTKACTANADCCSNNCAMGTCQP